MKLILFVICTLLLISPIFSVGFPPVIIRSCVRQTRLKAIDLALFYGTQYETASKRTKCYLTCLFESSGLIVDGAVNKDLVDMTQDAGTSSKTATMMFDIIQACKDVKVSGECEEGLALFNCFLDYGKSKFIKQEELSDDLEDDEE